MSGKEIVRLGREGRRDMILRTAVTMAERECLEIVTHGTVARRCPVPTSAQTVRHYFATKIEIWQAVLTRTGSPKVHEEAARLMGDA